MRTSVASAALLACLASAAAAQTHMGGIRGRVRDASGPVEGIRIELINGATGFSWTATSNRAGEYAFSKVAPGDYRLRATVPNFKPSETSSIHVGTQAFLTMPDIVLDLSQREEQVTVLGQAPLVENASASVGATLDRKVLETIPTAGRNAFYLSVLTPNVLHTSDPQFVRQQDQTSSSALSLAGGPKRANNYTLDGVSITDLRNRATIIPSFEATEEVRVQLATYDAEMGRTGGGVFNTTLRSGANEWHGSLLGQTRPNWGQSRLYFDQRACDAAEAAGEECSPKPNTRYRLFGGSLGGPIRKDRTFFLASFEGYRSTTARNAVLTLPTELERSGDFSQSGVTIYDPLTTRPDGQGGYVREPFPGNVIPADRMDPVALAMLQYWPLPVSGSNRSAVAEIKDEALQLTLKLDHRFGDRHHAALSYAWYDSTEPEATYYGEAGSNPGDPGGGALYRRVHVVVLNDTFVSGSDTVWSLRYGFTSFADDELPLEFDPATLGFAQGFLDAIPYDKFPSIGVAGFAGLGARSLQDTDYYSHNANASVSKLVGRHKLKAGADYRRIGMRLFAGGYSSGAFDFDRGFTRGPDPLSDGSPAGSSFASFLLGYPFQGSMTVASRNDFYINYVAGFVHDDFRVNRKLTLNLGLRYEFEAGLKESHDQFTVGFDRERRWPVSVPGVELRGGLMYAGVDGYPRHQGDPSKAKFAPRVGFVWSPEDRTVVRGGFGRFWAPIQYAYPTEGRLGTRGFTAITPFVASLDGGLTPCPGCSLTDPFPNGVTQPTGSANGIMTDAGSSITYVDQFRKSPYVDQFSVDVQRELGGGMLASIGYLGSRSRRISIGGSESGLVNINQLDPRFLSMGSALLDPVPNPFFGDPRFGPLALSETVPRSQLLLPYPQFAGVAGNQVSEGRAAYDALVVRFERRIQGGWGLYANYTLSRVSDNLYNEGNFYSATGGAPLDYTDFDAEYARSLADTPHRLNVVASAELPFGRGKRWLSEPGLARALLGGWTFSLASFLRSGFPVSVIQENQNSGLAGTVQRPNLTGADPGTPGSTEDRLDGWLNPAAWSAAEPFTLGNAPRTDTRVRTPTHKGTDLALQKTERLRGDLGLTIRVELINAFNQPLFLGPGNVYGRSDFGRITGVGGFPRMLQVMARLAF